MTKPIPSLQKANYLAQSVLDAIDRAHAKGFAEGIEAAAKIASGIERKASDPSKEIWWDVALEIANAIRAAIPKERTQP